MKPAAKANLLFEELEEEILVYDVDRHRVHSLNPVAAFLLRNASGDLTIRELADAYGKVVGSSVPDQLVHLGLERLQRARLLKEGEFAPIPGRPEDSRTRREAIRRLALLGLAIPTVMTVVTPTPAQAATLVTNQGCRRDGPANVGKCCTNHRTCILAEPKLNQYRCQGPRC